MLLIWEIRVVSFVTHNPSLTSNPSCMTFDFDLNNNFYRYRRCIDFHVSNSFVKF